MPAGGLGLTGWGTADPGQSFPNRAAVTLAALLVYRLGCHLPLPQLNAEMLSELYRPDTVSYGRPVERISIFALGVSPIFSALILAELCRLSARFRRWEDANTSFVSATILFASLVFAALQAFGMAMALESMGTFVTDPGWMFRLHVIATFVAATAFLYWLAGAVTRLGLGNGFWLLLALPTIITLPEAVMAAYRGSSFVINGGTQLTLMGVYIVASLAIVTAAARAVPDITKEGALLWPVILSYTLLSWMLAGLIITLPGEAERTAMIQQPQHPLNVIVFAVLVPLIAWGRARSRNNTSPAWLTALAAAAIAIPGYLLSTFSSIPFLLNGQWLVLLPTLALAILSAYRQAHKKGADG